MFVLLLQTHVSKVREDDHYHHTCGNNNAELECIMVVLDLRLRKCAEELDVDPGRILVAVVAYSCLVYVRTEV